MGVRIESETRPVQVTGSSSEGRSWSRLSRDDLIPGSRYVLKQWIGEGGMGVIYEAEHVDVRRPVAVKILRPEYATNLDIVNAFRFEARATSALESRFLVDIFDYFELPDGRSALVMELLDGKDLSRRDEATVPAEHVIGIGRQVCQALQVVHDGGLVHRDLKPENIFLTAQDGREVVKVLDFGIARLATQATTAQSGGTPLYTAPEVIMGEAQGPAADIYALGCVLYELLTGEPAFAREDVDKILRAHLDERPTPPDERAEAVPAALGRVVMRAISRDAKDRYESMAAFEAALCEAQIDAGITTAWDDLPLPQNIPAAQRERLLARMPSPSPSITMIGGGRMWGAIALSVVLGGLAVFAFTRQGADGIETLSPEQRKAQQLAQDARKAGSRAAWVYPSPDDVRSRTAYQAVLALEEMGRLGEPLASTLRTDFAATLTRLGDEYWEADGGARFSIAYYEQALLFQPSSVHARERAGMDQEAFEAFATRAAQGSFALEELVRVEPLVELAEPDDAPPAERLSEVRRRRTKAKAVPEPEPEPEPSIVVEPEPEPVPEDTEPEDTEPKRDPAAAKDLVSQARAAAKSGNDGRAKLLFERALAKDSRNVDAHAGLRDLAFDAGDYARAVRHGKRAARISPRSATHQLRLGDAYYRTHKYAQAEKAYSAAAKLGDDRAKWRLERAREKLGG